MTVKVEPFVGEGEADSGNQPTDGGRGFRSWVRSHPKTIAGILICIVSAAVIVAIAVPSCTALGCPRKNVSSSQVGLGPGAPRLLVNYLNESINALDLIPPILQQYVTNLLIGSSNIQVLDFVTESVLQEALQYLESEPSLNFLIRDFNMSNFLDHVKDAAGSLSALFTTEAGAVDDPVLQSIIDQMDQEAIHLAGGRKLTQASPLINDPFYVNRTQYYVDLINATGAWMYTQGSSNIVVAIIDTGTDLTHPDLAQNIWVNRKEIPNNGIDDDGNGYIDDYNGYSFSGKCGGYDTSTRLCNKCVGTPVPVGDSTVDPSFFHGTHVAGLVGAVQNNEQGITGLAPGVKLMILRVSDCLTGNIASSSVFQAFNYAVRMGAHIVSCSFTSTYGYGFYPVAKAPSYLASQATAYATAMKPLSDKGILAVVAAGNENINLDNLVSYGYSYLPCTVNLPNILCVGGVDAQNKKASFSNWGNINVHIGAPAVQIYSSKYSNTSAGVIAHTYGPENGTSMATPIVSGAAAMTLSLLGASDGNFFKAVQAKNLLMKSAFLPSTPLPWVTGSRVNPGLALYQATSSLSSVMVPLSPLYTTALPPATSLTFRGMTVSYFATSNNQFNGELSGAAFDTSAVNISSPDQPTNFSAFKYNSGVIVSYTAMIQLNTSGVWGVQVLTTANSLSNWVYINGNNIPINQATQIGIFTVNASGWFNFELRIAYPMANVRYNLLFKSPKAVAYSSYFGFLSMSPVAFTLPDYAPNAQLSSLWQVFYNKVNTTSNPIGVSTVATATPTAQYQYTTAITNPSAGNMAALLFPNDATAKAAVGFMQTYLLPIPGAWSGPLSFSVSCRGCQLLVDGVVVVDVYQPIMTGTAITLNSACLTLTPNTAHQLILRFAFQSLSTAATSVRYTSCNWKPPVTYYPIGGSGLNAPGIVYNPLLWQPEASVNTGNVSFIGGLQCDVYKNPNNTLTTTFTAQTSLPLYKVRLPICLESTVEIINGSCNSPWSFTLESVLPGLSAGTPVGVTYGVRCWTTWSRGFTTGTLTVLPASANPAAYLGGLKVFGSGAPSWAPNMTQLGSNYQFLSVDWFNVTASMTLSLNDNGSPVPINLVNMKLPIGGLADGNGNDVMNGTMMLASTFGAYTTTAYAPAADIPTLVLNDLTQAFSKMAAPVPSNYSSNNGLDTIYSYPGVQGSKVRYTQALGYFYTDGSGPQTIQVGDASSQSTSIVMGNVTVRNGPFFSSSSLASISSFQVYVPSGVNIFTNLLCKTSSVTGTTQFDLQTIGFGAWDSNQWAPTASAPLAG